MQEKPPHNEDRFLDSTLRPETWDDYIGQDSIKNNLKILISAARERKHPPEHLLFYGYPGLGKTTLAHLVAKEAGSGMQITSGPAIEKVGDLASILTNLSNGDVLFIDEVHRLNKMIEEVLYPAMESGILNIIIGRGPSARTIQLDLPPFTLIAATTRVALLSSPLRSRFSGGVYKLDFYSNKEVEEILRRSAKVLGIFLPDDAIHEIASRARHIPRIANQLLKRCRDYAQVKKVPFSKKIVVAALSMIGIDELGLTNADRMLLQVMVKKFSGGPVGLSTLSAALSEEEATIEEVHEPYLIQLGLLTKTPRGRMATEKTFAHLSERLPQDFQKKLL